MRKIDRRQVAMSRSTARGSEEDKEYRITVFNAANSWDQERMADRQLAVALSRHQSILYVDPVISIARPVGERRRDTSLIEEVSAGIYRLKPRGVPRGSKPRMARINSLLLMHQIKAALGHLNVDVEAVLDANMLTPTLPSWTTPKKVYWAQDDFVAMAELVGVDRGIYARNESRSVAVADAIIAANPKVAAKLSRSHRSVDMIPFGCNDGHFRTAVGSLPSREIRLPAPWAVLMGTLNDRLDLRILRAVVDSKVSLLIIGPLGHRYRDSGKFLELTRRPNVQWLGRQPFERLPRLLTGATVGIVPYTHSPFNEGSFPLKIFEYLGAGLSVVATDLPAVRWIGNQEVSVADDADAFAANVHDMVHRTPSQIEIAGRLAIAQENSWDNRGIAFADVLK